MGIILFCDFLAIILYDIIIFLKLDTYCVYIYLYECMYVYIYI